MPGDRHRTFHGTDGNAGARGDKNADADADTGLTGAQQR